LECTEKYRDIIIPGAAFGGGDIVLKQMCTPSGAFGGGTLYGSDLVRFVFVDEAGIGKNEPVSVVVGLIADADKHIQRTETALRKLLLNVPVSIRENFTFHVKDMMGDKYEAVWPFLDRIAMVKALVALPREIGLAIAFGAVNREISDTGFAATGMSKVQADHAIAFIVCLAAADRHIQEHGSSIEIGQIVVEDTQEMRDRLKLAVKSLAQLPVGHIYYDDCSIERLRSSPYFVGKKDDRMLQIADACAYALKRYLCGDTYGDDYIELMIGGMPTIDYRQDKVVSAVFFGRNNE